MSEKYCPPFTMTEKITNIVIEIGELIGQILSYDSLSANPKLRRENRIKTIHSSLAIENNTLSIEQATDVIDGKHVLAPPQDIREVKNAYEAYEHFQSFNPYSIDDLLEAHKFMMNGLTKDAGRFRTGNVGVYSGSVLVHAGSPANYVPELMADLFDWLKKSELHPLVKSCIFHFEFEFIHPFSDGNGRTGRLWQSLILSNWKPFFAWLPVETMIRNNQQEYYNAIEKSDNEGNSNAFVEFMLIMIKETLLEIVRDQGSNHVGINVGINTEEKVVELLRSESSLSASKIAAKLGITTRQVERIIAKLKSENRLKHIGSNKNGHWEILD